MLGRKASYMNVPFLCFLILTCCVLYIGCGEEEKELAQANAVIVDTIPTAAVINNQLTPKQLKDIKTIHKTFTEVYPVSLDQTSKNFQKDPNPEREIQIWMKMVETYKSLTRSGKYPNLEQRQEVFSVLLASTMMPLEKILKDVELTELEDSAVEEIHLFFMQKFTKK